MWFLLHAYAITICGQNRYWIMTNWNWSCNLFNLTFWKRVRRKRHQKNTIPNSHIKTKNTKSHYKWNKPSMTANTKRSSIDEIIYTFTSGLFPNSLPWSIISNQDSHARINSKTTVWKNSTQRNHSNQSNNGKGTPKSDPHVLIDSRYYLHRRILASHRINYCGWIKSIFGSKLYHIGYIISVQPISAVSSILENSRFQLKNERI